MVGGVPRADATGFRYKRLRDRFTGDENADLLLREEFENIATRISDYLKTVVGSSQSVPDDGAGSGIASSGDRDTDRLVDITETDLSPDHLRYKLDEGQGIRIETTTGHRNGLHLRISIDPAIGTIHHIQDFNTWIDSDGNTLSRYLPDDATGVRKKNPKAHILIIDHLIPHPHVHVSMYRPEEVYTQPATDDYHPADGLFDGDDRGRFEIRWQVVERRPFRTVVHFHDPTYGTIYISGPLSV